MATRSACSGGLRWRRGPRRIELFARGPGRSRGGCRRTEARGVVPRRQQAHRLPGNHRAELERNVEERRRQAGVEVFRYGRAHTLLQHGREIAPVALGDINAALSEGPVEAPSAPVSCAAVVAQRMGMSAMHAVMAAGFAGGIGLSGGACGALGAAIWVIAMNSGKDEHREHQRYSPPGPKRPLTGFSRAPARDSRAPRVAGRRFQNVDEHAAYLRDGGCSKVIEVLAAA